MVASVWWSPNVIAIGLCVCVMELFFFLCLQWRKRTYHHKKYQVMGNRWIVLVPRNKAVSDLLPNLTPVLRSSQSVSKGNSRAWINIQQRIILIVLQKQFWPAAISQPRRQHHNQNPQKHGLLERRERERSENCCKTGDIENSSGSTT